MKFLAIENEYEGVKNEDYTPFLKDEAAEVWDLYKKEIIREVYFAKEKSAAVIIFECNNKNEVLEILNKLPLVKNKLIYFEVYTLGPYTGLSRLMS